MSKKCRTCLNYSTKTFPLTKLVTGCTSEITYAQLLKKYAQFEYNAAYERHLPQFLCFLCCNELKSTYDFIKQAKECNSKLINNLTKKFCLQEEVIDLPHLQNEASVSIKKEWSSNQAVLQNEVISKFSENEYNLVTNKSIMEEPMLTTDQIIEYDSEDNLDRNKSFTAETEQIIEYDVKISIEIDNDNANTETNEETIVLNSKEEDSLSNNIKSLESVESLLEENSIYEEESLLKEQTFTCEKCPEKYNKKYQYLEHVKEKHNSNQITNLENNVEKQNVCNKIIKCRFCDHIAGTNSGLRYHERTKHGTEDDKFECKFCSFSTRINKYTLLRHITTAHKDLIKSLKAKPNNMDESIKPNTGNRLNNNWPSNDLITNSADEENSADNDNDKDEEESSNEDFVRDIINMKKKSSKKISTKASVEICKECGKILKNKKTLNAHIRDVHKSEDMFSSCPFCDRKCKRDTDLKIHIRRMHGPKENRQQPKPRSKEKRFMCAECSYTCTTSTVLNIHTYRHHASERPYKCDICSKSFIRPYDLRIHSYLHTGEKPYKCPICLKSFRDNSNLRTHKRLHTNKHPFACGDCGKKFSHSYNLSVHKRTHLKEEKLYCSVCDKCFQNKSSLNIHQINENHYDEVV